MKNLSAKLLTLVNTQAVSGYEWYLGMPQSIQSLTNKKGIRMGDNLLVTIGKGKKKILISAHMDEVGFFISKIEKDFVRVMPIGDIDIDKCIDKRLIFKIENEFVLSKKLAKSKSFAELKVYGIKNPQLGAVGTFEKTISSND